MSQRIKRIQVLRGDIAKFLLVEVKMSFRQRRLNVFVFGIRPMTIITGDLGVYLFDTLVKDSLYANCGEGCLLPKLHEVFLCVVVG